MSPTSLLTVFRALALALTLLVVVASPSAAADATDARLTPSERAALVQLLNQTHAQTLALIADLDEELWEQKPSAEAWSAAEIIEHLVLAEGAVRGRVKRLLAEGPVAGWRTLDRPPLAGLVELGSDRSRKFQAPEPIQPTGTMTRSTAVEQLMRVRAETVQWVLDTDADLHAVAAEGPIGVVLDGHGWLGLLAAHNLRHNLQLEEVLKAIE